MTDKTFFRHGISLIVAVFVFLVLAPSSAMAADNWSYPTSKPSTPFGGGNGSKSAPYIISTAQHLANLAYMVTEKNEDYDGKYFLQTKDIVLNDDVISGAKKDVNGSVYYSDNKAHFDKLKSWQPIGRYGWIYNSDFEGVYNGGGHSISGVYCYTTKSSTGDKDYLGLFGCCEGARISNLTIKDSYFRMTIYYSQTYVMFGSLIGRSRNSVIDNCHVENSVISSDGDTYVNEWSVGGLIGSVDGSFAASNCSFDGVIDAYPRCIGPEQMGNYQIGGLIGYKGFDDELSKSFLLENCNTKGTILWHAKDNFTEENGSICVGGLVGLARKVSTSSDKKNILRCVNRMDINVMTEELHDNHTCRFYRLRLSGIVSMSDGENINCSECANFGNINWGCADKGQIVGGNQGYHIAGISTRGNVDNCFNYGNINIANMSFDDLFDEHNVYIGQWIADKGRVTDSYAYESISYALTSQGKVTVFANSPNGNVDIDTKCKSNLTINGAKYTYNIETDDFTSQAYADQLNQSAGTSKYGLIKEAGFRFNNYLSLTSIGALANSLVGEGTEDSPYIVSNASDLRLLSSMFNQNSFKDCYFKLTADIDMTNEPILAGIGSYSHPFDGIFDGNGHYVRGLKTNTGALFYVLTGTVKNLALYDSKSENQERFCGVAYTVGTADINSGRIENCYVSSNVTAQASNASSEGALVGGICYMLRKGASISNCYYTGNVQLVKANAGGQYTYNAYVGGIATLPECGASIEHCYAVMGYDAEADIKSDLGGIVAKNGTPTLTSNYYYIDIAASSQQPTTMRTYEGTTSAAKYDIHASDLGGAWTEGKYYPVLLSAYHYVGKDSEGKDVAFDATDYAPTDNDILTLVPTDEQITDTKMWQLPNVAVYSSDLGADVLTSYNIIPDAGDGKCPLRYKASQPNEQGRVVGLAIYPWDVRTGVNWGSFCLPGAVKLSDLPEGCSLYVGGAYNNSDNSMNIVEVESVPAGVPFLVRYDSKSACTVSISMSGELKMQPQQADAASSLRGTFDHLNGSYMHSNVSEKTESGITSKYVTNDNSANCFSAYVQTNNSDLINLVDYLLLDEQSNETGDVIAANDAKTLNIKLRRTIKTGGWNTLCLPFSVGSSYIKSQWGDNANVEKLSTVDFDNATGTIVMKFESVEEMEAGVPYLVNTDKAGTIYDFGSCAISNIINDQTHSVTLSDGTLISISMIGSYGKARLLSDSEASHYFIQQDKLLRVVGSPLLSLGFRCWFKVTDASGNKAMTLNSARVIHADGTTTDIRLVDTGFTTGNSRIYDVQGMQHREMQRGVNIVNGKKIMK